MVHLQNTPTFDEKYITIIDFPSTENDIEKFMWLNENAARNSVDIKVVDGKVYMAFEDESDALIFKIKYM